MTFPTAPIGSGRPWSLRLIGHIETSRISLDLCNGLTTHTADCDAIVFLKNKVDSRYRL
jgi:hypothetical protein